MVLNKYGEILKTCINDIPIKYPNVKLDTYIIMPNHVHCIINSINIVGAIQESPVSNQIQINNRNNIDNPNRAIRELPLQVQRRNMLLSKIVGYIKMQSAKQINISRNSTGKSL
ncbi:MAG: hypothetical protein KJ893_07030 [Candidatus Omnitrophica bacterium]|nr:hypothetical protein [Candidatus Omnitrophota bacterium]MCG2704276.1 hypothetical protein [Candidatus Omnitrophota bacterium]